MKRSKILAMAALMAASASVVSCSEDNPVNGGEPDPTPQPPVEEDNTVAVTVNVILPAGVEATTDGKFTFSNITTQTSEEFTEGDAIRLLPGLYDVSYTARTALHDGVEAEVRASVRSVNITAATTVELDGYVNVANDDLVISEIFFAGTLYPYANQYTADNYVKLYNNTDHVVYADGIVLFETAFMSVQNYTYTPDIKAEAVAVDAVYVVPGSGSDWPVQPGEYFLIADNAMNHSLINPCSFDLSHADIEWYDISYNPSFTDIDNPEVPDMEQWYCLSNTMFSLHNRGYKSYGIARIPMTRDEYLGAYPYDYEYQMSLPAGVFNMSGTCYSLPNEWVVDMVNLSVDQLFATNHTAPQLDMGWTGCGTIDMDPTRYFHSVRRKYLATAADGRIILQDTNNSTDDFNRNVVASEIELQGSVINLDGDKATGRTIDGVTPAN